jgi:hypothetical protein
MAQVVEHLPSKYEAINSKLSTTKKKKGPKTSMTKQLISCLFYMTVTDQLYSSTQADRTTWNICW